MINGMKRKLNISKIKDDSGTWREGSEEIATSSIAIFRKYSVTIPL